MTQHISRPTWPRGERSSLLGLAFTNDLTKWFTDPLNLSSLGIDHKMIAGAITFLNSTRTYCTCDWLKLEEYGKNHCMQQISMRHIKPCSDSFRNLALPRQ